MNEDKFSAPQQSVVDVSPTEYMCDAAHVGFVELELTTRCRQMMVWLRLSFCAQCSCRGACHSNVCSRAVSLFS